MVSEELFPKIKDTLCNNISIFVYYFMVGLIVSQMFRLILYFYPSIEFFQGSWIGRRCLMLLKMLHIKLF